MLTLRGALVQCVRQRHNTFVDLDAGDDALFLQQLHKWRAVVGLLVESFVEEDDARDVISDGLVGGEQQLAVQAAVLLGVLRTDASKPLSDRACAIEKRNF